MEGTGYCFMDTFSKGAGLFFNERSKKKQQQEKADYRNPGGMCLFFVELA